MFRRSILAKLVLMTVLLAVILGGTALALIISSYKGNIEKAIIQQNKQVAELVVSEIEEGYLTGSIPFKTLRRLSDSPNISFWWIVKPDGEIYLSDDPAMRGWRVDVPIGGEALVKDYLYKGEGVKLLALPLKMGEPGWAFCIGIPSSLISEAVRGIALRGLAYFSIAIAMLTVISFVSALKYTRPLLKLAEGMRGISRGNFNVRVNIKTGDELEVLWNAFNEMGRQLKIMEERKMALKDSALENSLSAIAMFDMDGRLTYVNPSFLRMWGYGDKGEVLGKHLAEFGIEEGFVKALLKEGGYSGEMVLKRRDGSEFIAYISASLARDEGGNPIQIMASFDDITPRRMAEEALRESEERYSSLVESTEDSIYLLDRDCRYLFVNQKHLKRLGYSMEEIYGKGYGEIHSEDEARELKEKVEEVFRTGSFVMHEHKSARDGRYFLRTLSPVKDGKGNVIGVMVISKDITSLKYLEQELRARNAEMERFAFIVSHDLREPLITISGFLRMLRDDLESGDIERAKGNLKYIERATLKMDLLLSGLLELSRIGRVANPPEIVPFGEIVEGAIAQVEGRIRQRGVRIKVQPDLPSVYVDRMRIEQVLVNLISNSIKYMGDEPNPEIVIGYRIGDGGHVFFVEDNGVGIEESQREKVFDLFYQIDKSKGGVGLGLAICKRIIDVHGGRIWIESPEKGKGCRVCFTLPVGGVDEGKKV